MLIEGRLDFLVDDERVELEPYDTLVTPQKSPHLVRALDGETATLLAFWPFREDRFEGTTYQREFPGLYSRFTGGVTPRGARRSSRVRRPTAPRRRGLSP
ncbi:cupin domain-containing protein [Halalkalicoccus jeotgali]|uniref:Uncharacterized protein n=1 Tax=Halalkalicoccus jeotgali (strain DSM 18796 / CECT 7217 / JCM 14584 / KCTC 4019 / B3) TaxID=795797 RepID=D8J7F3_HALJB|nr:cupin domain-containing protein [Halalkalicoccus jeotgali]ADJ14048.1 hypothetical protein HacjB3_03275 [Halalkalicoccus jeotgali B3]ELY33908.1 hypothetical protein C497_16032 [Halalkalicoccus jeotgali B3]